MNFINADQRAAQITERLRRSGNNDQISNQTSTQSTLRPEERIRMRADVQSRSSVDPNERRFDVREKGLPSDVGIKRSNVVSKNSNIISSSTTPSINAADRAAAIRKQRELDYAKSRGMI